MNEALVNPELLRWARERAGYDRDAFARKLHTKSERVASWESGERRPTFKQAEKLARVAHVPFGYLFLPAPPDEPLPIPDLRTRGDQAEEPLSGDFRDLLRDVTFKLDWYREHLGGSGARELPFIGRFGLDDAPAEIALDIIAALDLTEDTRREARGYEEYLRLLVRRAEAVGITVMRSGTVGGNTHRPLSVTEFRGFAISDPLVPLVFINGRDAKAAQIFTFAHELAHLWTGQSGISNPALDRPGDVNPRRVERLCNEVAAEMLVPAKSLKMHWQGDVSLEENVQGLAPAYRVSSVVVARRAADLGLLGWDDYRGFYQQEAAKWDRRKDERDTGGDYYRTATARSGERLTRTILANALSGNLLLRDASQLLNVRPANLKRLARKLDME